MSFRACGTSLSSVVLLVVMSACSGSAPPPKNTALDKAFENLASDKPEPILACMEHQKMTQELRDGVLSNVELRGRLKVIYEKASVFPNSAVATASAATIRNFDSPDEFRASVRALVSACKSLGY